MNSFQKFSDVLHANVPAIKEHAADIGKVVVANGAAWGLTLAQVEALFRTAGVIVAFVYTCFKLVHLAKHWNNKAGK